MSFENPAKSAGRPNTPQLLRPNAEASLPPGQLRHGLIRLVSRINHGCVQLWRAQFVRPISESPAHLKRRGGPRLGS